MKQLLIIAFCLGLSITVNAQISFVKLNNRNVSMELPESIKNKVVSNTKNMDVLEIASYCVDLTCDLLSYSTTVHINPDLKGSKGHCVTYSTICKELCNVAYLINNIDAKASVAVGQIKIANINLHNIATSILSDDYDRFVKDHDIVEISYGNKTILMDPSFTDIFNCKIFYNTTSE